MQHLANYIDSQKKTSMAKGKKMMRSMALIGIVCSFTCVPFCRAADAPGKMFQLVTKQDKKVVAEFSLSENDSVMIVMEKGEPQVRSVTTTPGRAGQASTPVAKDQHTSTIGQAKALLQKGEYEAVITLLSDDAYRHPSDFEMNLLLVRAEVEKCEQQKERGDRSYKAALRSIYQRAQRLYAMNRTHPEPYYIVAKSLYLNGKAPKAYDTVRKAIYYDPLNPYYQLLYGDLCMEKADIWQNDMDSADYVAKLRKQALAAYEKALDNAKDEELANKTHAHIDRAHRIVRMNH